MKDIFLVDVDDTILDFRASSAAALRHAFCVNGIELSETLAKLYETFNDSLWLGLEQKKITRAQILSHRFIYFFESLDRKDVDGEAVNREYLEYLSTHPVYIDGAQDFLVELAKLGKIYFVTNGTEKIQKSRFEIANLYSYAEKTFVSEVVGFDKPAKEYTNYVISQVKNFDRERTVWIGDSLSADIQSANDAKIESVWFNPKKKPFQGKAIPDFEAESYLEILAFLKK